MNIYRVFCMLLLCCFVNQGLAWWGGGDKKSSSKDTSSKSNRSSNGSGSKSRDSGWWGGGKKSEPKPKPKDPPAPKPKPKPKDAPAPKPKPKDHAPKPKPKVESKPKSGWWGGTSRNVPPKPQPKPKPETKTTPEEKPKKKSGWWSGTDRNVPPKQKPQPETIPKKPIEPKSKAKTEPKPETDMKKVIEGYEGMRLKAYDAQPKNPKVHDTTIGIGFNMNRPDARKTFEKMVPGVDFDKVKTGKQSITKEQARALFDHDVDTIYEPRARDKVGKEVYDKLPSNVKTAVVNAVYRGDLGPKTTKLIKEGKWSEVGKEYLDHNQYKNADKLGIPGVKTRMDWNKKQFDTMIKQDTKKATTP